MDETLELHRGVIKADWVQNRYYADAEAWTQVFWAEGSPFLVQFRKLDLTAVVELACGHGRHTAQILSQAGSITLVDINESNIAACRQRFADQSHLRFLCNTGNNLPGIADGSQTALFCYDAMVHFELLDVLDYLREIRRVLVPGGRALLHVSNNRENPQGNYQDNRHWRNFGGVDTICHFASRVGMSVLSQQLLNWSGTPDLDGLLLLEKPR